MGIFRDISGTRRASDLKQKPKCRAEGVLYLECNYFFGVQGGAKICNQTLETTSLRSILVFLGASK